MGKCMVKGGWFFLLTLLLLSCSRHSTHQAQGYIEGQYTYMATSVSGALIHLAVGRGDRVKKGQLLFTLESQPESDSYHVALENVKQAVAARDAILANLHYAKVTLDRNRILVRKKVLQPSELDKALASYESSTADLAKATASISAMKAELAKAIWVKDQKIMNAPLDAQVFDVYYRVGEYTTANQAVVSLLAPADIKVIFYINEADLGGMRLKEAVTVQCDQCEKVYPAQVSFISPRAEYTPPVIYSEQTREKLIYRIEAVFKPEDAIHLHPGQPVTVAYTHHAV
ncbi:MAG: hypothetical protein A3E85_00920 [Gammaproteobacteria bacterium RIFCSPHIGHO2_12_FULL_45_12]|nr:MAG: hypothetical protein A3E85_00920 [Gammaproteobacteria bacterium RIFCSPHIGHO2_12_FULL_45_12]